MHRASGLSWQARIGAALAPAMLLVSCATAPAPSDPPRPASPPAAATSPTPASAEPAIPRAAGTGLRLALVDAAPANRTTYSYMFASFKLGENTSSQLRELLPVRFGEIRVVSRWPLSPDEARGIDYVIIPEKPVGEITMAGLTKLKNRVANAFSIYRPDGRLVARHTEESFHLTGSTSFVPGENLRRAREAMRESSQDNVLALVRKLAELESPGLAGATPAHATATAALPAATAVQAASPGASPGGAQLAAMEAAIDFNVLDAVSYDRREQRLVLAGHHDPRFGDRRIPYLQHLATSLQSPHPEMSLKWTPDSRQRIDALFSRMQSADQRRQLAREMRPFDDHGRVTPMGRWVLPLLGVPPKNPGAADPWSDMDHYDMVASMYASVGKPRARDAVLAMGRVNQFARADDVSSQGFMDAMWHLMGTLDYAQEAAETRARTDIPPDQRNLLFLRGLLRQMDRIFELPDNPTQAAFNRLIDQGVDPASALEPSLNSFAENFVPMLERLLDTREQQVPDAVIPLEGIQSLLGIAPEVRPEFYDVEPRSELARLMLEADYLAKKLPNLPVDEAFPGYQTYFAWEKKHPEMAPDSSMRGRLWLSVETIDARRSPDGYTLETRDAKIRFNIRRNDGAGNDLPPSPASYEQVLTDRYSELAARHPVLHELEEAAKIGAAAAWIRSKHPTFTLPAADVRAYAPPARLTGIIYLSLDLVKEAQGDNSLLFSAEGGVSLTPFGRGNADIRIADVISEDVQVVDLRGLAGGFVPTDESLRAASRLAGADPDSMPEPVAWIGHQKINGRDSTIVSLNPAELVRDAPISTRPGNTPGQKLVAWRTDELDARIAEARKAAADAKDDKARARDLIMLSQLLHEKGDNAGALRELKRGTDLDPDSPVIHLFLAQTLASAGQRDEAIKALETYVRLEPFNQEAAHFLQELREVPVTATGPAVSAAAHMHRAALALRQAVGIAQAADAKTAFDDNVPLGNVGLAAPPEPDPRSARKAHYKELSENRQRLQDEAAAGAKKVAELEQKATEATAGEKAAVEKELAAEKEKQTSREKKEQAAGQELQDYMVTFPDLDTEDPAPETPAPATETK